MAYYIGPEWLHSVLLLVMIMLILTGRRSGSHLHHRRARREQAGLRAALVAELSGLLRSYELDAQLLAGGATQIVAARLYFSAYRGNMTRLVGLSPAEITALVTAHAAGDTLDAAMQIVSPMRLRQRQRFEQGGERLVLDVPALLRDARLAAQAARDAVAQAAAAAEARRTMADRVRGLAGGAGNFRGVGAKAAPFREAPQCP